MQRKTKEKPIPDRFTNPHNNFLENSCCSKDNNRRCFTSHPSPVAVKQFSAFFLAFRSLAIFSTLLHLFHCLLATWRKSSRWTAADVAPCSFFADSLAWWGMRDAAKYNLLSCSAYFTILISSTCSPLSTSVFFFYFVSDVVGSFAKYFLSADLIFWRDGVTESAFLEIDGICDKYKVYNTGRLMIYS